MEKTRIKTSLRFDPELWKRVKIRCIEEGVDVQDLLDRLLREYLQPKKGGGQRER